MGIYANNTFAGVPRAAKVLRIDSARAEDFVTPFLITSPCEQGILSVNRDSPLFVM